MSEQNPRGAGVHKGIPYTAFGTSFGSPGTLYSQTASGGSSVPRPPRAARYNTATSHPASHPVNPSNASHSLATGSGSILRSASRARPPLNTAVTALNVGLSGSAMTRGSEPDDDEAEIEDRGQALIKRRQQERRNLRRSTQKRINRGDDFTPDTSAPPTGQPEESFRAQQVRGSMSRSMSRARTPSASRREASDGYFYQYAQSEAGLDTPRDIGMSPKDDMRAPSLYSSTADEDEDEPGHHASVVDDVIAAVVDAHATAGSETASDELDIEENGEGDEAVTLKDRQDVSKSR